MSSVYHYPDRRSPYVFGVLELGRHSRAMKEIRVDVLAPADFSYDVISVPQGSEVDLDLKLEVVVEGVLVTGAARVQVCGEYARCLSAIEDKRSFDLQELYFYSGNEVDEDESVVVGGATDLKEVLRDAMVLELPFMSLCDPDCLSLCQECGFNLNDDPDHGHEAKVDPWWKKFVGIDISDEN